MQITQGNWQATIKTERGGMGFTRMEATYLLYLADGSTQKEIAKAVGRQPTTVKHCLERAYQKLNVTRGTAAIAEAMKRGLIAPLVLALMCSATNPDADAMRPRQPTRNRTQSSVTTRINQRATGSLYA